MKKLFFLLLVVGLASCSKDEEKTTFDLSRTINIREAKSALRSAEIDTVHLSGLEIVKQTALISGQNYKLYGDQSVEWGFSDSQRDTITPCLKMLASQIINPIDGTLTLDFIEGEDLVFIRPSPANYKVRDTIAYISNSDLKEAKDSILIAFNKGDYPTVYSIFDRKFTYKKTTGKEWRDKKALNQQ